jgi:hypothetical protein
MELHFLPKSMQQEMLKQIHESHMGVNKCKSRARDVLFWIGMASQIEDFIRKFSIYQEYQKVQSKEPMIHLLSVEKIYGTPFLENVLLTYAIVFLLDKLSSLCTSGYLE